MNGDTVAVAAVIGGFVVAAVIAWGIFSVGRAAVGHDRVETQEAALTELTESHRQLLQGQKEAAELLAELRGTTMRIEAMLREVG
jgi:hypothetical protein